MEYKLFSKILLMLILGIYSCGFPQGDSISQFSINEGLSQSQVNTIFQDRKGFLWIGTQDGLNRYDGYSFRVFRNIPDDSLSISNNFISAITETEDSSLWIGTGGGGLLKYSGYGKNFHRFQLTDTSKDQFYSNYITSLVPGESNSLWIGTRHLGLVHFNGYKFRVFSSIKVNTETISHNDINIICRENDNFLWIGTINGINRFNISTGKFTRYFVEGDDKNKNDFLSIVIDKSNNIIASNSLGELYLYDKKSDEFINVKNINIGFITCLLADDSGNILAGTEKGFFYGNINSGFIIEKQLENSIIKSVFKDRSGVIWIGTVDEGLYKMVEPRKVFHKFRFIQETGKSSKTVEQITGNCIWSFFEDSNGIIWIGSDGQGVSEFNRKTGSFRNYTFDNKYPFPSINKISSVFEDKDNNIWLGTFGEGIIILNKNKKPFKNIRKDENNPLSLSDNYIWKIISDNKGNIWIGTYNGLNKYNPETQTFSRYFTSKGGRDIESKNLIAELYCDSHSNLWIGTYGSGLIKFNPDKPETTLYVHTSQNRSGISNNSIMSVIESSAGDIWIGTDIGLNRLDIKTGKFVSYTEKDGLPNDIIYAVREDKSGNIWVSTNRGLSMFDIKKNRFINYDTRDGLQSNEFNQNASLIAKDGTLFFGGIHGFNMFNPEDFYYNRFIPQVEITKIRIWNNEINPARFNYKDKTLVLSYFENFISFDFTALDFTNPSKNRYAYKLEGFDKEWIYPENLRTATYTNLNPGEYILRVIASNDDGVWNMKGTAIKITVLPPYWLTWWFRVILISLIICIIYLVISIRVKRLLEIEKLRTRIASDLHDEVGSSLTKINLSISLIKMEQNIEKVKQKLIPVDNLCREVISSMSDTVWSIDSRNDTFQGLIDRMKNLTFNMLQENGIDVDYEINIPDIQKKLSINFKQNVYLIFKEAVNNIAKHSKASKVEIAISGKENNFYMQISDNGTGLPEEVKKTGFGLRNMKMRAERIKGKIEFISDDGLRIILSVMKNKNFYHREKEEK